MITSKYFDGFTLGKAVEIASDTYVVERKSRKGKPVKIITYAYRIGECEFHFTMLCEVGRLVQGIYKNYLIEKYGTSELESLELESDPYIVELIPEGDRLP